MEQTLAGLLGNLAGMLGNLAGTLGNLAGMSDNLVAMVGTLVMKIEGMLELAFGVGNQELDDQWAVLHRRHPWGKESRLETGSPDNPVGDGMGSHFHQDSSLCPAKVGTKFRLL